MPPSPDAPADRRPLSERRRPGRLGEVVGNTGALARLRDWAGAWAKGDAPPRYRAALLIGPPGVGKTTAALAVAAEFGWTVVEMNASEARNQGAIELVAGRASMTHTLGDTGVYRTAQRGGRSLVLLDEADCLSGRATEESSHRPSPLTLRDFLRGRYGSVEALNRGWKLGESGRPAAFPSWAEVPTTGGRGAAMRLAEAAADLSDWRGAGKTSDTSDRGGLGAIAKLVRETRQPLVLTVNDDRPLTKYSPVFRSGVLRLNFDRLGEREMSGFVERVAAAERISASPAALAAIVRRSRGDLRAALNDLEAIAPLPAGRWQEGLLGVRDSEEEVGPLVEEVLATPRFYRSVELRNRIDATPDDLLPWFEEGALRLARTPAATAAGIAAIARAERNVARSRRYRVYGLWSYATEQMTGGVSVALSDAGGTRIGRAPFPTFLAEMGRSRSARALRQSVLDKVDHRVHVSRRKGVDATFPFLESIFAAPGVRAGPVFDLRRALVAELGLTHEEVGFLAGAEPDAEGVQALYPKAVEPEPEPAPVVEEPPKAPEKPAAPPPTKGASKKVQRSLGEF